ncbi:7TM diverse intracellular signaling domain-containing protein [Curvibacter sp. HBC61]|uniref:7TM diverse intracellular signaling domain-containing protein n=1 Tax=Curvibacter cyanobacteriorum TaxID=3026422 RepID=A0ABT5N0M9_9BURK|nr:7TM diverse intracellular signaling domain-containing protein [Curvibacter sp. HBC61]MDD0839642.1 7TM diverse intracellular signaling domain-containing protein [Curvibacter sp. HBC61]
MQGLPAPVLAQTSTGWNGLTPPAQRWSDNAAGSSLARAQQRFLAGDGVLAPPRDPLPLAAGQVVWLAIDLPEVNAARRVVLSLPQAQLERATLHWQGDGGQWLSASAGALLPVARWPMPYLHPAFDWTLQAGQSRVYLALEGSQPLVLNWRFWSRERFDDSSRVWHLGLGAFLGFVLLVSMLCGVQAGLWRDPLPLWFALGALALGGSFLTQWGLTAEYLWPQHPLWAQHAGLALPTAAMALLLLFLTQVAREELPPRWGGALWGVVALGGLLALGLGLWGPSALSLAAQGYDLLVFALGFLVAYRYARRDTRVGVCLLAGWLALLLGALLPQVRGIGDASWGPLSQQAMQWGGLWALPLLMVGLCLRGRQRRDQWVRRRALTRVDALTGVCSERVLIERLDHLILRQHRQHRLGGVMRIRISNLKAIFRTSGPQALEAATLHASHCISQVVRRSGDTLARVSNGDFVLLLEGEFKPQGVQDLAQMVIARGLAHASRLPSGTTLRLHVSCTAGFYPGCDAQSLLNRLGTLLNQMGQGGGRALQLLSPGQLPGVPGVPGGAGAAGTEAAEPAPMRWSDPLTLTPLAQRTRMPGLAPGQGDST